MRHFVIAAGILGALAVGEVQAATYTVNPGGSLKSILGSLVAGDTVNVMPGTYNEVMKIQCNGTAAAPITIRGIGGARPVFDATGLVVDGVGANPRAIFQIEGDNIILDNLEMKNARNGNNGAGVRILETWGADNPVIRNCKISNCDMGMMGGGSAGSATLIENCDVGSNGAATGGYSHNFYMSGPGTVLVRNCYIHDATDGQNFKSRAHYNELWYNWISDSSDGEVGPVDGGSHTASVNSSTLMAGNVVVSKQRQSGFNSMSYIKWGNDMGGHHNGTLYAYYNTLIAGDTRNAFLWTNDSFNESKVVAKGNIFYGSLNIVAGSSPAGSTSGSYNWMPTGAITSPGTFTNTVYGSAPGFISAAARDYLLAAGSQAINAGTSPLTYKDGAGATCTLVLDKSYILGAGLIPRILSGQLDIGAYEYMLPGDDDCDGDVDFTDYQRLEASFGRTAAQTWVNGDFNGDGGVDFADYQALERNFGQSVPEPAALALVALGGLGLAVSRRARPG